MGFLTTLYYIILILKKRLRPLVGSWAAGLDPGLATVLLAVHAAVRPLGAGQDVEAQLRRLQLSGDPERPGSFRLEMLGAGPGAVVWSGPWSQSPTQSEAPASMSCSLHPEGLGLSACTSPTLRKLSGGQP